MDKPRNSAITEQTIDQSLLRIFESDHLTLQMAIPYLYQHRNSKKMLQTILSSIHKFSTRDLECWVPMIVYIYSESNNPQIQSFLHLISNRSIPMYLIIRWCLATFIPAFRPEPEDLEIVRNKLDTKFINNLSTPNNIDELTPEDINDMISRKVALSNYVSVLNKFYEKLFRIPQKLKQIPEHQRKNSLQIKLSTLLSKFTQHQETQYCSGVCFPLCPSDDSYLLMDISLKHCRHFSTKERIPFRIVFETINFEDYDSGKMERQTVRTLDLSENATESESLILPHSYFGENWSDVVEGIRKESEFGHLRSYRSHAYMVKSGDDFRQEYLAMQMIKMLSGIFQKQHLKLYLKPYRIIPFTEDSGLIEFISGTQTISNLKAVSKEKSLRTIYKQVFGQNWETATTNFIRSLAGYSLFQYLFQVKDRHNNNILIDRMGHALHIDFSFFLNISPGNLGFEKAPFKFTQDYVELMEGLESDLAKHFKFLMVSGLKFLRKYKKEILGVLRIMRDCPQMKCWKYFDIVQIEKRFHENTTDQELENIVENLVKQAYNSYTTSNYDRYQWLTNQIRS